MMKFILCFLLSSLSASLSTGRDASRADAAKAACRPIFASILEDLRNMPPVPLSEENLQEEVEMLASMVDEDASEAVISQISQHIERLEIKDKVARRYLSPEDNPYLKVLDGLVTIQKILENAQKQTQVGRGPISVQSHKNPSSHHDGDVADALYFGRTVIAAILNDLRETRFSPIFKKLALKMETFVNKGASFENLTNDIIQLMKNIEAVGESKKNQPPAENVYPQILQRLAQVVKTFGNVRLAGDEYPSSRFDGGVLREDAASALYYAHPIIDSILKDFRETRFSPALKKLAFVMKNFNENGASFEDIKRTVNQMQKDVEALGEHNKAKAPLGNVHPQIAERLKQVVKICENAGNPRGHDKPRRIIVTGGGTMSSAVPTQTIVGGRF